MATVAYLKMLGCAVGHNDLKTLIVYWIIPNGYA